MVRKFFFKALILSCILFIILYSLTSILVRPGHSAKLNQGWYNKDNSYDVLLLGSSHMNGLINPNVLFDKYGITSFNYGTGGQPIDVTYYLLKEALKIHSDTKLVVLDVYYLGLTDTYGSEGYIRNVLDNMKLSKNKLDAIINCTPKNEWFYYLFPIFKYHNRWGSLTEKDYNINLRLDYNTNGFEAGHEKYGYDIKTYQSTSDIGKLPPKSQEYLYKFIALSKEIGFQLLFINAPYDYSSNDGMNNWYNDDAKMFNKVLEISSKNNIPFINYSSKEKMDKINFDFKEDMNNAGHTNVFGAHKVSLDFADFLNTNYNLENHKS